jgi:hypothetical protein
MTAATRKGGGRHIIPRSHQELPRDRPGDVPAGRLKADTSRNPTVAITVTSRYPLRAG